MATFLSLKSNCVTNHLCLDKALIIYLKGPGKDLCWLANVVAGGGCLGPTGIWCYIWKCEPKAVRTEYKWERRKINELNHTDILHLCNVSFGTLMCALVAQTRFISVNFVHLMPSPSIGASPVEMSTPFTDSFQVQSVGAGESHHCDRSHTGEWVLVY